MRLAALCIVGLCVPGALHAETRFPRDPQPPASVPFSDRVRPPPASASAQPPALPALSSDVVFSVLRVPGPVRDEQERILADLIANTPDSEATEKAEYLFRLGELYARQMLVWQRKVKELPSTDREAHDAAQRAKLFLLKAVKTFKALTDNQAFRDYPKLDLALFYYGYALQTAKYMKEARAVYDKLLKSFPSSKYVPEAHLAFAEYFFDNGQLADAEARYQHLLKFPASSVYWFASYRLGAIDLQLGRAMDALERFLNVAQRTRGDATLEPIHRAATIAIARSATGVKPEQALALVGKLDKPRSSELMDALATQYFERGTFESSIRIHRELLRTDPSNARACEWNYDLSRAMLAVPGTKRADQVKQVEALVASYVAGKDRGGEGGECRDNAAAMAGELARAYHVEAAKTANADTLASAERLYVAYLGAFPDAPDRVDVSVSFGELLWARANGEKNAKARAALWERAADAFTLGASRPEIARVAILAWKNALDVDPSALAGTIDLVKSTKARVVAPRKLPPRIARFIAAADALGAALEPSDPELPALKLIAITFLRTYHHDDDAISRLEHFLDDHHDDARGELAANLLLDLVARTHQFDDLLELVDLLATDTTFIATKPALVKNLALLRSRSLRSR